MPGLLYLFAFVNLVIGSGAFAIGGVLSLVAADLHLSVAAAGQAMTAYAASTAVLAPMLLAATGRWPARRALLLAVALVAAGGALCATAGGLPQLLAGRVVMGIGAAFTPLAAGIAVALVAPARRGQALALVFLGMGLSYVIGLPAGSWLGFTYGWPVALAAMAGAAAVALLALALYVPRELPAPGTSLRAALPLLARADVVLALLVTLLYFSAIFSVFSYIGPVLRALVAMDAARLAFTLMLFGLGGVAGTLLGGAANDRFGALPTMRVLLAVLLAMMLLLPLAEGHHTAVVAVLLAWGTAGFGLMAPQQSRLTAMAPAQAPMLLSLNASMLYLGTAVGAAAGGLAATSLGLARLSWAGAVFATLAWLLLWWTPRPRIAVA